MITVVTPANIHKNVHLLAQMFQLRSRVFFEELDWDVTVVEDMEGDRYDTYDPVYLIARSGLGEVCGCARLMPSTGPNSLNNNFPVLISGDTYQRSEHIWECSRFIVDTAMGRRQIPQSITPYTYELLLAMLEFGLSCGWTHLVSVTDLRQERVLSMARWPLLRIGKEYKVGATWAVAGLLDVSEDSLHRVRRVSGIQENVITNLPELQMVERETHDNS
jgi:acyl homoserine lactone synthase